jgi:ABC-type branched-subunit amino acid transport system substrate-binding protein
LLVVLVLIAAACGGGRDDDSAGDGDGETAGTGDDGEEQLIDTSACETDPASVAVEGDTIRIGTSLPQSGLYAGFSNILLGEQAYIEYVNEELGGVEVAGTQYQIELVDTDDEYLPAETVSNVNQLITDDDVFALFNVVGTRNNLAIREIVNEECVPNLFAATGSPAWGNPEFPWTLGTGLVPYPLEMKALVDYLGENDPDATIAILRASDDFGRSYSETLTSLVEGTDLRVVQERRTTPNSSTRARRSRASPPRTRTCSSSAPRCSPARTRSAPCGTAAGSHRSSTCRAPARARRSSRARARRPKA